MSSLPHPHPESYPQAHRRVYPPDTVCMLCATTLTSAHFPVCCTAGCPACASPQVSIVLADVDGWFLHACMRIFRSAPLLANVQGDQNVAQTIQNVPGNH